MGNISVNKLGGLALILGPIVTLVFFFLTPGGAFIDAADPANVQETITAIVSNSGMSLVSNVFVPIGLLHILFGVLVLQGNLRGNGNGDALSRAGALLIFVGILGWVTTAGVGLAVAGADAIPVPQAIATFSALYSATLSIGTLSGILAGLGFLALALAISTRDDYNKMFALVAAITAVVVIVASAIGLDSSQLEAMSYVQGVCYLIHSVWFITLGLKLIK